jgi:hypothetical protein
MEGVPLLAFVFLAGLTVCGFCGTVFESITGLRLSLREPFVSVSNLSRSLVLVLLAGPFMVANEALAALSERRVGTLAFIGVVAFCLLWLFAAGIFVVGLVEGARDSLG